MRALLLLAAVTNLGCGAVPAKPLPGPTPARIRLDHPPLGVPGEAMEYEVALRGVTVGRVVVAVGELGWVGQRRAIIVRSRGTGAGVLALFSELSWDLTTTIDLDRSQPIDEVEETRIGFAGEEHRDRRRHTWSPHERHHNVHSAVGVVRGWQSEPEQRAMLEVVIDRFALEVELWQVGREYLASAGKPAVRYAGKVMGKYDVTFWLSDDTQRVPLSLQSASRWGTITVDLVDYTAPRG